MTRKTYTKEFKAEMVKMVIEQRVPAVQAAKDYDVGLSTLDNWVRKFKR